MKQLDLAICGSLSEKLGHIALCQIELADGKPPQWVQLVPAGANIKALDGREFANKTPDAVVAAFDADPRDLPIDWEHASEIKAPEGEEAPASGWVTAMEVRDGAIWGKVEWTPRGLASLETREYRYLSPAFLFDKARNILQLISAALVNRPAFDMPALASHQETTMDPKLLELLGITADATPEQISEAVVKLQAKLTDPATEIETLKTELEGAKTELETASAELANARNAHPDLKLYVPRADYDAQVARANKAETDIAEAAKASHAKDVETEIEAAMKAGKIVPATKDFYVATCAQEGGLESFREFLKTAPVIGEPSGLDNANPPAEGKKALTADEKKFCVAMNLTEDQYRAGALD